MAIQRRTAVRTTNPSLSNELAPLDANVLMREALGDTEVTVDIPETATIKDVEATLRLAINAYQQLASASERIKPIIGRILLTVQDRKLYRPAFKTFTGFLTQRIVADMGFGRSNAFEALRIARAFPTMTQEDYLNYGATRLLLAAKVTDESDPQHREILDNATQMTTDNFRTQVYTMKKTEAGQGANGVGEEITTILAIRVLPSIKLRWAETLRATNLSANDLFVQFLNEWLKNHGEPVAAQRAREHGAPAAPVAPANAVRRRGAHAA